MAANRIPIPSVAGVPVSGQLAVSGTLASNTLYTCPIGTKAQIQKLVFLNTTGTQRAVTVAIVRVADGAIAAKNEVWIAAPVPLNTTSPKGVECFEAEGQVLSAGDILAAYADAATAVTPEGSVVEFT